MGNFERACDMLYKDSKGEKFGSPLTASADKTNGCGEAEYVLLTDDCDTCNEIAGLLPLLKRLVGLKSLKNQRAVTEMPKVSSRTSSEDSKMENCCTLVLPRL